MTSRPVLGLILDVRGTLIHPVEDDAISRHVGNLLCRFIAEGAAVSLNTATSITSLQELVIPQISQCLAAVELPPGKNLVFYVDSGSIAYYLPSPNFVEMLSGYTPLTFEPVQLVAIHEAIIALDRRRRNGSSKFKVKPGQVNFYCGGSWEYRSALGEELRTMLASSKTTGVEVMVPTAKDTIDIATCRKDRGARDFARRFSLPESRVCVIGDSMQEGGPDLDMQRILPNSRGWHVGNQYLPPADIVNVQAKSNIDATISVLEQLLSELA